MTFQIEPDRLTAFLMRLAPLDLEDRQDALMNEIIETGGKLVMPNRAPGPGQHYEISLHGITGSGPDVDAAIRNWIAQAGAPC